MSYDSIRISVLTGDIVGSTALSGKRLDLVFTTIAETVHATEGWIGKAPVLSRSRGDGWQALFYSDRLGLRAALCIKAALGALDTAITTRIGIASGLNEHRPSENLNETLGSVFVSSGRALEGLKGSGLMTHASGGEIGAATILADHIAKDWTAPKSEAVGLALQLPRKRQTEIAEALGKTPQAISKSLIAAGFPAISDALKLIEGRRA